jgi:hypothetical protein
VGTRTVILISMHARVQRIKGLPASFVFAACAVALAGSSVAASAAPAKGPSLRRIAATADTAANSLGDPSVKTAEVYGPNSRVVLVKASSADWVRTPASQRKQRFYLIVLRGHFVCQLCSRPPGGTSPRGTIATLVWSPVEGTTDFGLTVTNPPH